MKLATAFAAVALMDGVAQAQQLPVTPPPVQAEVQALRQNPPPAADYRVVGANVDATQKICRFSNPAPGKPTVVTAPGLTKREATVCLRAAEDLDQILRDGAFDYQNEAQLTRDKQTIQQLQAQVSRLQQTIVALDRVRTMTVAPAPELHCDKDGSGGMTCRPE